MFTSWGFCSQVPQTGAKNAKILFSLSPETGVQSPGLSQGGSSEETVFQASVLEAGGVQ